MEKKPKICILRWEEGQVLPAQLQLESLPGNSTNPASYPFEIMMVRVKGANMDTIEENPCQEMLDQFIAVCKDLAAQGVKAITTSCGFTAYYQEGLAAAVPELVFTSSLLQVPLVQAMVGPNRKVAVLTANKHHLREEHLQRAKITDREHLVILSLHDQPEWSRIYTHPHEEFDLDAVTDEVIGVVRKGLSEHPDIGAVVLECTDLPPYSARIREELDIPVFDINTFISYIALSLNEYKMF